ncbi:MAG: hypothetical protein C5B55_04135 [Blastocatellia bacterium]|nr:MAG: hypothetical protein C5B55_04135 [Blastocatellia bacterium]
MGIKITGFDKPPSPQSLPSDVIAKECSGEKNGCFLWNYDVNGDNVKFKTRILLRNDLSKSELPDVLEHERHHWRDFNRLAVELKAAVEKAAKAGQDPQIDDRLEWMLYDYCRAAAAFHRQIEHMSFEICDQPKNDRPK